MEGVEATVRVVEMILPDSPAANAVPELAISATAATEKPRLLIMILPKNNPPLTESVNQSHDV